LIIIIDMVVGLIIAFIVKLYLRKIKVV